MHEARIKRFILFKIRGFVLFFLLIACSENHKKNSGIHESFVHSSKNAGREIKSRERIVSRILSILPDTIISVY